jgi:aldehyde dehydrogenase (NAD+)
MRLALPAQVEQARQLVEDALARGGNLLVSGDLAADGTCRPAVISDANEEMELCREAIFAPLLAVMPFDTLDQALAMEARCPYALGASIFTHNHELARHIATRLRAGTVTINDVIVPTSHPATPFGGRGASGWGVTQGAEGLVEMTVPQVVSEKSGSFRPHYDMSDPQKLQNQGELLRGFLEAGHAPRFAQRLRGWWRVIRAAIKGL